MQVSNTHENLRESSRDNNILERYVCFNKIVTVYCKSHYSPNSCGLFIWDDELDELTRKTLNKELPTSLDMEYNNSEAILGYLREFCKDFRKEFGKEFDKQYGKDSSSKKV